MISHSGPEISSSPRYAERLVGMMAPGHPLAKGELTLERLGSDPRSAALLATMDGAEP